nr:uncharacterized protein LOC128697818 [Cherax quadricarinatus]
MLNVEGGKLTFSTSHDDLEKLKRGATPSLGALPHRNQAYIDLQDDTTATSDASSLPSSHNTGGSPNWSAPPDVSVPPAHTWWSHLYDGFRNPSPGTALRSPKSTLAQVAPQTQHTIQFFTWLHSPDPSVQEEKILVPVSSDSHATSEHFPLLYKAQTYQPPEGQTLEYPIDSNLSFDVSQERPSPPPSEALANFDNSESLRTILYPEESTSIGYQDSSSDSNLHSSVFLSNTRIVYPDSSIDFNFDEISFSSTTSRVVNKGHRKTTPSNTRIVYPDKSHWNTTPSNTRIVSPDKGHWNTTPSNTRIVYPDKGHWNTTPSNTRIVYPDSSTDSSVQVNTFPSPDAMATDVTTTPASNTNFTTQTSKPAETDIKIIIDVPPRCRPPCERQAGPVCIIDHFCLRIGTDQKPG